MGRLQVVLNVQCNFNLQFVEIAKFKITSVINFRLNNSLNSRAKLARITT